MDARIFVWLNLRAVIWVVQISRLMLSILWKAHVESERISASSLIYPSWDNGWGGPHASRAHSRRPQS